MAASAQDFDLDRFLPYLVNVLASRLSTELAQVYARFGISVPEWRLIAHLAHNRKVSVREIFVRVDMDKAKVSRAAARLEAVGLIEKRVNGGDRRLVELSLTAKGRRLFLEIAPLAIGYEEDFLARLSPSEAKAFRRLLGRLLAPAAKPAAAAPDARRARTGRAGARAGERAGARA
jgi:DNA-binding MarR family transcriptional regulator